MDCEICDGSKKCPECDGAEIVDGEICEVCDGEGTCPHRREGED